MFPRIFSAPIRIGRKLAGVERDGRLAWSLAAADALGLGVVLFILNGLRFHHALDQDDYATVVEVPPLVYAACLQYRLVPGRPARVWALQLIAGQALAAAILVPLFAWLGMDLSGRELVTLLAAQFPLLALSRATAVLLRRRLPGAPLEVLRLALVACAAFFLFGTRYSINGRVGSGDGYWYALMTGDFASQLRAGAFPVFAGQSLFAFNGSINPLRLAPGFQHAAGLVDLLTGRSLSFPSLQNLTVTLLALAAGYSAYLCLAAILPRRRWIALALAVLYLACPGTLALGYEGDQLMSLAALPWVPLCAYGLWRTLREECATPIAWTALPLAAAWWCHPPIALWLTFAAALAHLRVGLPRWREPGLYAWWAKGLALFALTFGYVFVSVASLRLPHTPVPAEIIVGSVRAAFPGMLRPLPEVLYGRLDEYQLGWSLLGLLSLAAAASRGRGTRAEGTLLAAAGAMFLLLLPIPGLNRALWSLVPAFAREVTFYWPMQRFCPVMAGLAVVAAAGALARRPPAGARARAAGALLLAAAVGWSLLQANRYVSRDLDRGSLAQPSGPDHRLEANNLVLTRYAFVPFPVTPPYFTHGYMDPWLENQILAPDQRSVLASNSAAARPGDADPIAVMARYDGGQVAGLAPGLALAPGRRYAVRFVPADPALPPGVLTAGGPAVQREFMLPDPAEGMPLPGKERRDFFSLWTLDRDKAEAIDLTYAYRKPPSSVPADFGKLYVRSYAVESLPVKVTSWIPYRAEASAAAAGAWLETPRLWVPGYAATVNGRPAPVSRTPSGLVAVRLEAGANQVELRYPGPVLLRLSYFVSLAAWLGCAVLGGRAAARSLFAAPA